MSRRSSTSGSKPVPPIFANVSTARSMKRVALARRGPQQHRVHRQRRLAAPEAAGVGHDRDQRERALRVPDRDASGRSSRPSRRRRCGPARCRGGRARRRCRPPCRRACRPRRAGRAARAARASARARRRGATSGRCRGCRGGSRRSRASASCSQKSSCHASICVPRPMISRIAGSPGPRRSRNRCRSRRREQSLSHRPSVTAPAERARDRHVGAEPDRAADAGAAEAAVAVRHLRQVLLVVVLGVVELVRAAAISVVISP